MLSSNSCSSGPFPITHHVDRITSAKICKRARPLEFTSRDGADRSEVYRWTLGAAAASLRHAGNAGKARVGVSGRTMARAR